MGNKFRFNIAADFYPKLSVDNYLLKEIKLKKKQKTKKKKKTKQKISFKILSIQEKLELIKKKIFNLKF